ncbi:MAG: hypothetical protein M1405_02825 [Patescibacteria group bacterium]|nr:hypothetical protein [Patescibacteria group bacterium]
MIDTQKLLTIFIEGSSFVSVLAGIAAGFIMVGVTKKFGSGILASGFKSIAVGIFFIAGGILVDALESYLQVSGFTSVSFTNILLLIKAPLFIIGTYIIVIGSKRTGDKLESLTK